jgi:hypothetical protein
MGNCWSMRDSSSIRSDIEVAPSGMAAAPCRLRCVRVWSARRLRLLQPARLALCGVSSSLDGGDAGVPVRRLKSKIKTLPRWWAA